MTLNKKKKEIFLIATTVWGDEIPETPRKEIPTGNCSSPGPSSKVVPESPIKSPTKLVKSEPQSCPGTPVNPLKNPASEQTPSPSKRGKYSETEERHITKVCNYCVKKNVIDKSRPPKIYYCTRTHSQIAQVVKQLKGTAYSGVKMTILSSREPTCINEDTLRIVNTDFGSQQSQGAVEPKMILDDQCITLVKNYFIKQKLKERRAEIAESSHPSQMEQVPPDPPVCDYFLPKNEMATRFADFQRRGAWDLEDIKLEGKKCTKCPFYGCHSLHEGADIIFGSYNYLLEPKIREATSVEYINSVLVFDEAHNIEDICRNVFSFTLDLDRFDNYIRGMVDSMLIKAGQPDSHVMDSTYGGLKMASVKLKKWSDKIRELGMAEAERLRQFGNNWMDISLPYANQKLGDVLLDIEMTFESVSGCLRLLGENDEEMDPRTAETQEQEYYFDSRGRQRPFKIPSTVIRFLKSIQQTLEYLWKEEKDDVGGIKDFKGFLTGVANPSRKSRQPDAGGSRRSLIQAQQNQGGELAPEYFFKFEIICLNPALGFRHLHQTAFSIIVASGTLTPLNSFASELATRFAVTLQADHVIPDSNVWTGVISCGPSTKLLRLNRSVQDDEVIQDDIGRILCDICYNVPNGVLVFFPSYGLMRKLENRWRCFPQGNSIYKIIQKRKLIFTEESKDKKAFALNMQNYKENVKGGPTWDGCLLFAVFRGKISEGIDFADEQARAVVTIGIPYSSAVASEIVSKKEYNDMRKSKQRPGETFLSGSEWYTTQAFRAMNQGFGRCVRHCDDWGALILIDSRMGDKYNGHYISSWVKKGLRTYTNFDFVKSELQKFIERMKKQQKRVKKPIHIEFEQEPEVDLDSTEPVMYPNSDDIMDSQDDQMLTQVYDDNIHNMTTQRVLATSSTPHPPQQVDADVSISNVSESSEEYSFTQEVGHVLGSPLSPSPIPHQSPPAAGTSNGNDLQGEDSDSSVSLFDRTPDSTGEGGNDSDREMMNVAERLDSTGEVDENDDDTHNNSNILDVSMPSAYNSDNNMSQMSEMSNISYHSDWDASIN